MKFRIDGWVNGNARKCLIAFPKVIRIYAGRSHVAIGLVLPVGWFWDSTFNNCLWFFRTYERGLQFRVLVIQVGLLRELDVNGDAW